MTEQPLFERAEQDHDQRGPGWTVHTNARGIVVCRPRYWVHPDRKDPEWARTERAKDPQRFDVMEGELWDVPAGTPYCPRFAEEVREVAPWRFQGRYVADAPALWPGLAVIRGFDGGLHRPALIMGQYDRDDSGILWIQREFRPLTTQGQPIDMQAHEFLAVVRYLCGQATIEQLEAEERAGKWSTAASLAWIEQERRRPFYGWPMPWISPEQVSGLRFYDGMAGHEAQKKNELASFSEANTLVGIYRQHGLRLRVLPETWPHRALVLEFLLRDGTVAGVPRLLIDSSCKTLLRGLAGGLVAAPPGRRKPYVEDRYLEDALDAFFNVAVAALPLGHADRLMERATRDKRAREASVPRPQQTGRRYVPPLLDGDGSSYGGIL